MRQILVEYARGRQAAKRNGGRRITFNDVIHLAKGRSLDLVALDDALNTLAGLGPQQSRIVGLKCLIWLPGTGEHDFSAAIVRFNFSSPDFSLRSDKKPPSNPFGTVRGGAVCLLGGWATTASSIQ